MAQFPIDSAQLELDVERHGLRVFGSFEFSSEHIASGREDFVGRSGVLIGNTGPAMWDVFSKSKEYSDGQADPMNRWTRRVLDHMVMRHGFAVAIYPFDKPFWPFQRFLQSAVQIKPSPLGLYIHPEFGLWHALRGVLVLTENQKNSSLFNSLSRGTGKLIHPCDNCEAKPCLSACPVGAFDDESLSVNRCFEHLDSKRAPDCLDVGCRARAACPIGAEHGYSIAQVRFHMRSYRGK